jgi:SAM-dependent methyltransferase
VTALGLSAEMLDQLQHQARRLGVGDLVHSIQADLDQPWPAVGPVDLVWASSSLHHLADPDRALSEMHAALRPGGLLVLVEMAGFPRFLPDDLGLGRPGLEARLAAVQDEDRAERFPQIRSDWAARVAQAGFGLEAERTFAIDLRESGEPLPAATRRYAQAGLARTRAGLAGRIGPEDLATLEILLDSDRPEAVLRRQDLTVRTTRTGWVARRP